MFHVKREWKSPEEFSKFPVPLIVLGEKGPMPPSLSHTLNRFLEYVPFWLRSRIQKSDDQSER